MFIDMTTTCPSLNYMQCPNQLVIRVGDTDHLEGLVAEREGTTFKPVIEEVDRTEDQRRSFRLREYRIQPNNFNRVDVSFDFVVYSAIRGVRGLRIASEMALNYDGESWDFALDTCMNPELNSPLLASARFWVPLPSYDPLCEDPTPLQVEYGEDDSPSPRPTAWDRLREG